MLAAALLLIPWVASAEAPARVSGRVLEAGTGDPVAAEVIYGETRAPVAADGTFSLEVAPGPVTLTFESVDHRALIWEQTLGAGESVTVKLRMERHSFAEEIVVRAEGRREEVDRTVVSAEELRSIPGSFGDPIRALQSLPGVARPSLLEGTPVVRGAEATNTATWVDEVPVPYLFHFFVGRSIVNGALLDEVEFFPGGMPSRFGNTTQAVVNAKTTAEPPKYGVQGRVSVDLLDSAVGLRGRAGDHLSWHAAGRWSYLSGLIGQATWIAAMAQGERGYRPGWVAPHYYDQSLGITWKGPTDTVRITWFGARDALILHPAKVDEDGDGHWDPPLLPEGLPYDPGEIVDNQFQRVVLRHDRDLGEREISTLLAVGPQQEQNLIPGFGAFADGPQFARVRGFTGQLRHEQRAPLPGDGVVKFGFDGLYRSATIDDWSDIGWSGEGTAATDTALGAGLWGEVQVHADETLLISGMRASAWHFGGNTYVEPEPRLTIRHPLPSGVTLTGFAGRFTQMPPVDRYAPNVGNPEIGILESYQASVGAEKRLDNGVRVELNAWVTDFPHLMVKDQVVVVESPDADVAYDMIDAVWQDVRGFSTGIDALVRLPPRDGTFAWAGLTLSKALRFGPEGPFPANQDQPVALVLVGQKTWNDRWELSARFRATHGHPFTPQYGVYLPEDDEWNGLLGERNSERFPPFRQLDLRVARTTTRERTRTSWYLDAYNATNARNYLIATYSPTWERLQVTLWVPIIPALGVEVTF